MCVACVGQGVVYVGGAVGALRVMAARAEARRRRDRDGVAAAPEPEVAAGAEER